ncbi:hypothetical protein EUTSA_v10002950mg, partial [Eutrema salsugineum]
HWKSTIQSASFKKRHLLHRKQSGDPEPLLVYVYDCLVNDPYIDALRTLVLGPSLSVKIPTPWENKFYNVCNSSCDGLIYLYDSRESSIVIDPTTRWHRTLPPCNYQLVSLKYKNPEPFPGFGKDKINDTYKPVWLYNSDMDHFIGSLLGTRVKTKILSFGLHAETFQIISKTHFVHDSIEKIAMCNLDDRLCVSENKWPNLVIWSLDSDQKTWTKIYSIDL